MDFTYLLSIIWILGSIFHPSSCAAQDWIDPIILNQLENTNFATRQQAEFTLLHLTKVDTGRRTSDLIALYNNKIQPETRKRLRSILTHLALNDYYSSGIPYVGIQMLEEKVFKHDRNETIVVIRISQVFPGSPAVLYGLEAGDLILELDDLIFTENNSVGLFKAHIAKKKPLDIIRLIVMSASDESSVKHVKLGKCPLDNVQELIQHDLTRLDEKVKAAHFQSWIIENK